MKFSNIKPGMTLYDVRKNVNQWLDGHKYEYFPVHVIEVNAISQKALVSYNNNPPLWKNDRQVAKYRMNPRGRT